MTIYRLATAAAAALLIGTASVASAQTTTETKVSTKMSDGKTTKKVEHVTKRKTHRAKKILGVKVGTKTKVAKTVHETTTDANGATSTSVKQTHN